eukprot:182119_1
MATTDDMAYIYGLGSVLGVFSGIFASVGLLLLFASCTDCSRLPNSKVHSLVASIVFRSVFALIFIGVPLVLYAALDFLLALIIGYSIPFIAFTIWFIKRVCNAHPIERNTVIHEWLQCIGLTQYHDVLVDKGFLTVHDLQTLSEDHLRELNITNANHIKKIMDKLNGKGTGSTSTVMTKSVSVDITASEEEPMPNVQPIHQ